MAYAVTLGVYFFTQLILVLSANLQLGLMGMANLGFVLFLGLGAYVTAILSLGAPNALSLQHYFFGASLPFPLPLLLAMVVGAVLGLIVGLISLYRMRGHYLAIVTLAILSIVWTVVDGFPNFLGGENGLDSIPQPFSSSVTTYNAYQWLFLGIAAFFCILVFWFSERFFKSPLGRMAKSIRENEAAAATLGINPFKVRLIATVCGSAMAALAGGLLAEYVTVWGMQPWSFTEIFPATAAMIIGGRANNWGAAVGTLATFILVGQGTSFLPGFSNNPELSYAIQWIIYGVALVAFLWFRPRGLIPEQKSKWRRAPAPLGLARSR
ncbi:MAG TPA: branched-chain amino acid ABC transporter permease [Acidimicrobiales bacterium]|nr:branched-chain amino acid ABC transporter permease [Acidimicrobiales bacterium]